MPHLCVGRYPSARSVCLAVETVAEEEFGKGSGKKVNVLGQEGAS